MIIGTHMKQVKLFALLLIWFCLPVFLSAGPITGGTAIEGYPEETNCALAPPSTVTVSNITGFSAQVSWTPVQGATWYKVRLAEVANPNNTTTQYTTNTFVTLNGLIYSTNYIVFVSATECSPRDPFGIEQMRPFTTPAIIIDDALLLERCSEFNIEIPIVNNTVTITDLPQNIPGAPPTDYVQYEIVKNNTLFIQFALWVLHDNNNNTNTFTPYYHQFGVAGLSRFPNTGGSTPDILIKETEGLLDLVRVAPVSTGPGMPPLIKFEFLQNTENIHVRTCKGGFTNGGDDRNASSPPTALPQLTAVPNPFNDQTTLHYTVGKDSPVTLTLYNSTGSAVKTILNGAWAEAGAQLTEVQTSDLPNGLYFVVLETNEGRQVSTLVKTN